ncbi:transcription factor bHLH68-like isoform X1 [Musa acuminata AAA Group]|uniref:transcription factor bHLH68-like isoform X1 n=1 Tax=Musa acuminata AAA Group TaxID=214697 RepID=UPI0031CEB0EA
MNRGLLQNSVVQKMMGGSSGCRSMNSIRPPPDQTFPLLPSSSSSSSPSVYAQFPQPSAMLPITPLPDSQELPESWSQLLLGGCWGEEEKYGLTPLQTRKIETWEDQLLYPSAAAHVADVKREYSGSGYLHGHGNEEEAKASKAPWSQIMPASSPRSCITTSFSRNMLDFSNKQPGRMHHQPDNSSVCNSTAAGAALKKARVQGASSAHSAFKVRKEKLGDRITALHQIVSPFGKTDTASVLLEAIGYIRFLQSQVEALSSPYLSSASANTKQQPQLLNSSGSKKRGPPDQHQEGNDEVKKDLRSRGLCLVPVSFFLHVGTDTGADFWPPALHGAF